MATYYLDGTSLANSTAIFSDAALTICAADGFYSDGVNSRELVSCSLLPQTACVSCATPCGGVIAATGTAGVYKLNIDVGGTATDIGAIVITFYVGLIPDGLLATFGGVNYNKLSSPNFGKLQGTVGTSPTVIGDISRDCSISGGTFTGDEFLFDGTNFVGSGNTVTYTIPAGNNVLTNGAPGNSVMVIPKTQAAPNVIDISVFAPCPTTGWDIDIQCPTALTTVYTNTTPKTLQNVCSAVLDGYLYHVPVNTASTPGNVNRYDYLFIDQNGAIKASDGYYKLVTGAYVGVTDGIVTVTGQNCVTLTINDCDGGGSFTMTELTPGSFIVGDTVQYQTFDPITGPSGITKCGTITSIGSGVNINAVLMSDIIRECGDTTHC